LWASPSTSRNTGSSWKRAAIAWSTRPVPSGPVMSASEVSHDTSAAAKLASDRTMALAVSAPAARCTFSWCASNSATKPSNGLLPSVSSSMSSTADPAAVAGEIHIALTSRSRAHSVLASLSHQQRLRNRWGVPSTDPDARRPEKAVSPVATAVTVTDSVTAPLERAE